MNVISEEQAYDPVLAGSVRVVARSAASSTNTATSTANAAAVITKAAVAAKRHVLGGVVLSAAAAAAAGTLTIEDVSGTTVFSCGVNFASTGGTLYIPLHNMKTAAVNTALIVTLSALGASAIGKVNLVGYFTE